MPSVYMTETMKYDFSWEDLDHPSDTLKMLLGSRLPYYQYLRKEQRPIAGNKRVAKYLEKQEAEHEQEQQEGGQAEGQESSGGSGSVVQQGTEDKDMGGGDAAMKD
ncbi:hypothetical protein NLJ89_g5093 [Agrocybe chaxingu]|uniref:Uncharacterized protein n=1 Tax=Agrocybe chaxingu TaxID=84603 RepID=A0A9W8K1N9_9AGAR|nr:hypothetical protein NLJ89_g5093 [Agrocybe chaxingu]